MSATGLKIFDSTVQETNHWLKLMMGELCSDDRQSAFNALRAALHAIRDRIGVANAAHLGAQLPMLLRGAYYEAWRPAGTPTRERHLEDFVDHVAAGLPRDDRTVGHSQRCLEQFSPAPEHAGGRRAPSNSTLAPTLRYGAVLGRGYPLI